MKIKRIGAYLFDYAIVILIAGGLSSLSLINPYIDKYSNAYNGLYELVEDMDASNSIDYLEDHEFVSLYSDYIRYGSITTVITVVCYLLYFVGFQKWNKDTTVGKKLFGIKVVSNKGNTKVWQYILRSMLVYNLIPIVMNTILVFILDKYLFVKVSLALEFIFYFLYIVCIFMILFRKDNKGLHDIISGTEVVLA